MSESNNENKLTDFNISQSYILSQREPEQAIYVPMTYWNFMKKKLTNMKTSWHIIDKIGGVLLGTGITTLLTLFIGKYQNPTNESWLLAVLFIFLGIACMIIDSKEADKTLNNILIIPDIEGIVVSKIYELEDRKKFTAYGIVNSSGKLMIPTSLETVYSITNNGRDEYTMIYNGDSIDILEYVREYGLDGNTNDQTNETTNELTNEITNTVQNTQT